MTASLNKAAVMAALPQDCTKIYGDYERGYNKALTHVREKVSELFLSQEKPVAPLVDDIYDNLGVKALLRTSRENVVDVLHALIATECRAAPNDGSFTTTRRSCTVAIFRKVTPSTAANTRSACAITQIACAG
jgi:hypothetical protein